MLCQGADAPRSEGRSFVPPLTTILREFPAVGPLLAEPVVHRGFSGAVVWEVAATSGRFALRHWPSGWERERLIGLHELLRFLRSQDLEFISAPLPTSSGHTLLLHEGVAWQLEPWLSGRADFHQQPSRARLAAAMTALARWHQHATRFQPRGEATTWFSSHANLPSPAVLERLERLKSWTADRIRRLAEAVIAQQKPGISESRASQSYSDEEVNYEDTKGVKDVAFVTDGVASLIKDSSWPSCLGGFSEMVSAESGREARHSEMPGFETLVLRLAELVSRHASAVRNELQLAAQTTVPLQPVLRDVWHDHVLFTGDDVTGLIDASACRSESVSADLARLLGSLLGEDDREGWDFALTAYQRLRPLSVAELALIPVLDRSGVLLSAVTWLEWLGPQRRVSLSDPRVRPRLEQLMVRLSRFDSPVMTELWQLE
jgi:Ser/Thr protein kinase RdoA (MazF antagonist)